MEIFLMVIGFLFIAITMSIGVPIIVSLGLGAIIVMELTGVYSVKILGMVPFDSLNAFPLLAMPLFILTGDIIAKAGIADRLIEVASSLVGWLKGSLGMTTILGGGFFAGVTGSNSGETAVLARIMGSSMIKEGYTPPYVGAISAASGVVGIIIPPSIALIIFGMITGLSPAKLFIAGLLPGGVMVLSMMVANFFISFKRGYGQTGFKFDLKQFGLNLYHAKWAIFVPILILGGIYGGIFTATEAAAAAVGWCLLSGGFLTRERTTQSNSNIVNRIRDIIITPSRGLKFKDLPELLVSSAEINAVVAPLIAMASVLAEVLAALRIPGTVADLLLGVSNNQTVISLLIFVLMLIMGCIMEQIPNVVIFAPIFLPVAKEMGMNPYHFGLFMETTLTIGFITPPVGINLFVASEIFDQPLIAVAKEVIPFLIALCGAVLIILFVPGLSLGLLPK